MKRDTLKTIIGLVVIAAIVVATFMYGNAQRTAQLQKDKDAKKQTASATVTPQPTAVSAQTSSTPGNNTAPVKSPSSNAIQGGSTPAPATGGSATSNANGQVAGAATTVPVTGGSGTALPETGSPVAGVLGLAAMIGAFLWLRRSQQDILAAARGKR